jgi:hypothetical protein
VVHRYLKEEIVFEFNVDVDQLNQILGICGTPDDATLSRIGSERAQMYIRSLSIMPKVPFASLFPNANPQGNID